MTHERAVPATSSLTARRIAQGDVVGFVAENGAHVWRGPPLRGFDGG
jgi:hypothetical protein